MKTIPLYGLALLAALAGPAHAAEKDITIPATVSDVSYGSDPKQKLDVYVPTTGKGPFPILLWTHGGGWFGGDKRQELPDLDKYLAAGCAVVSVNYRLVGDAAKEHITPPIVAVLGDNRRSLQYVRLHAVEWNLDPTKIAVGGGSAGACSTLYLGCEGEQANPQSADPVERVSTKVLAMGPVNAQASIDPQWISENVPGVKWGQQAFGYTGDDGFAHFLAEQDKWTSYIEKYSPDHLLTKDAPPIFFSYTTQLQQPASLKDPGKQLIHSPLWAIGFQKLAQERGVTCYLLYPGHPPEKYTDLPDFILHQLGLK